MSDQNTGLDPAAVAASEPETDLAHTGGVVYAVGIGPGHSAYLTPRAERAIHEADVVVGFESVIAYVRDLVSGDVLACEYDDEAVMLEAFADRIDSGATGTAVLMGDPNHSGYQFVGKVQMSVDRPVRIIPGISSLQVAASRARTPMEASTFVTLHKRGGVAEDLRRLRADVGTRHLLVLPRPYDWMPEAIARDLFDSGASGSLETHVYERLTHSDERVTRTSLDSLASMNSETDTGDSSFSDLSVLVVRAAQAARAESRS